MSSWVAPSIAAEILGISVDQVWAGINNGSIPSYADGQFMFVDVTGKNILPSAPMEPRPRDVVTAEEIAALTFSPREVVDCESFVLSEVSMATPDLSVSPADSAEADEEDVSVRDVGAWRLAREETSRVRRPPQADAA